MYHVRCSCEKQTEFDVLAQSLLSGNTRSCGCLNKEYATNVLSKLGESHRFKSSSPYLDENGKTKYDLTGEYGIGWTSSGDEFFFDKEDYDKIKDYFWETKHSFYGRKYVYYQGYNQPAIYMHRLIKDLPSYKEDRRDVDHINHNTLDNRKENLRICEHYQNTTSQKIRKDNKSGKKGVSWSEDRQKWLARITYNKKSYFLGRFENFEDAVAAREKAEKEIHGEFNYIENKTEE